MRKKRTASLHKKKMIPDRYEFVGNSERNKISSSSISLLHIMNWYAVWIINRTDHSTMRNYNFSLSLRNNLVDNFVRNSTFSCLLFHFDN